MTDGMPMPDGMPERMSASKNVKNICYLECQEGSEYVSEVGLVAHLEVEQLSKIPV